METKPGYKSSEWYLSVAAAILGALLASGVLPDDSLWMKLAGLATSLLATLGYQVNRAFVKNGAAKASAFAASNGNTAPTVNP